MAMDFWKTEGNSFKSIRICSIVHVSNNSIKESMLFYYRLPPPEAPTEQNPNTEQEKPVKSYARFLDTCRKKMSCQCCKKQPKTETPQEAPSVEIKDDDDEKPKKVSCFNCCRKKKPDAEDRENLAETEATSAKKSCWERLKCCRKNEDGKGCCSRLKRKERWAKRMDSILSEPAPKP